MNLYFTNCSSVKLKFRMIPSTSIQFLTLVLVEWDVWSWNTIWNVLFSSTLIFGELLQAAQYGSVYFLIFTKLFHKLLGSIVLWQSVATHNCLRIHSCEWGLHPMNHIIKVFHNFMFMSNCQFRKVWCLLATVIRIIMLQFLVQVFNAELPLSRILYLIELTRDTTHARIW